MCEEAIKQVGQDNFKVLKNNLVQNSENKFYLKAEGCEAIKTHTSPNGLLSITPEFIVVMSLFAISYYSKMHIFTLVWFLVTNKLSEKTE